MDPMFDLAGPLLRKLYPDWVSLETIEATPESPPARRLRRALRQGICGHLWRRDQPDDCTDSQRDQERHELDAVPGDVRQFEMRAMILSYGCHIDTS